MGKPSRFDGVTNDKNNQTLSSYQRVDNGVNFTLGTFHETLI